MKKQTMVLMVLIVGILIVSGCGFPEEIATAEFNRQNTAKLKMLDQRQQYFTEHLNLSPQMERYVLNKDKIYFKPLTEEDRVRSIEFETNVAETLIGWIILVVFLV